MNIRNTVLLVGMAVMTFAASGQEKKVVEPVYQTFKDTRVINAHSVETLKAGRLDFRIGHRFGDIAGEEGGWPTFFGLENASDVLIGFEYGMTDNLMIGISRTNGGLGSLNDVVDGNNRVIQLPDANVNGLIKWRLATQNNSGLPYSITLLGMTTVSTAERSQRESDLTFFAKGAHRLSYHGEFMVARKFSNYFSLQMSGAWTYRNITPDGDQNDLVSVGINSRIQMSKSMAIILDGRYVFSELRTSDNGYYPPLGIGLEWETGGGHVFQLNLTNATGLVETDFIPYTRSNWGDGGFRLGFTIGRQFKL